MGYLNLRPEVNLTDAEVTGYRFQPQVQRLVLEDWPEESGREKEDTRPHGRRSVAEGGTRLPHFSAWGESVPTTYKFRKMRAFSLTHHSSLINAATKDS